MVRDEREHCKTFEITPAICDFFCGGGGSRVRGVGVGDGGGGRGRQGYSAGRSCFETNLARCDCEVSNGSSNNILSLYPQCN